jgi:hypothetical protein
MEDVVEILHIWHERRTGRSIDGRGYNGLIDGRHTRNRPRRLGQRNRQSA